MRCLSMPAMLAMLGVAIVATFLNLGQASGQSQSLVGQWVGNVNGQMVTLSLSADGSAEVMGTPGRWEAGNGQIVLSSAQGQLVGQVQGSQLVFQYNGQSFAFSRGGGGGGGGVAPAPAGSAPRELVGTWTTSAGGQQLTMTLGADGSADVAGARGTWSASGGQIVLASAQGQIQGVVQGGQLIFAVSGQQYLWTRSGGGPAAPGPSGPSAPTVASGAPFKPERTLPGRTVSPEQTQMSFTLPKDWSGAWTQIGNQPVYAIQIPGLQGKAMVGATARVLGNERSLPVATLLQQGAMALWGHAAAGAPLLTETFTVHGHAAGRIIHRAAVPNPATGQVVQAEGYLGVVLIDDWALGFAGLYEAAQADNLRPGMDTMLASLSGTPPARNRQMEQQIAGCWESGTGTGPSTSTSGSAFTSAYVRIAPDGTYRRSGGVAVSTPDYPDRATGSASGQFGEQGQLMIHGSQITWIPSGGGASYSNQVGHKPGGLYLDGKLWIKCI